MPSYMLMKDWSWGVPRDVISLLFGWHHVNIKAKVTGLFAKLRGLLALSLSKLCGPFKKKSVVNQPVIVASEILDFPKWCFYVCPERECEVDLKQWRDT